MKYLKLLLIFIPIGIFFKFVHPGFLGDNVHLIIFIASALAIVPLSAMLGEATEELAKRTGSTIGGLLNATLGNLAELIITIFAIQKGLLSIVKASITGSIIGNILFVLGLSLLVGGIKYQRQKFNQVSAGVNSSLMTLAVIGLVIPAVFYFTFHPTSEKDYKPTKVEKSTVIETKISEAASDTSENFPHTLFLKPHTFNEKRWLSTEVLSIFVAGILMATYLLGLLFSLKTHKEHLSAFEEEEHEAHEPKWSLKKSFTMLAVSTAFIAIMSETLIGSVEHAAHSLHLGELFIGAILIPIIGNAAEHSSAVMFAYKNKMDLSMGIAVGSSTQVALFVAPLLVFVSLILGNHMDLVFTPFEIVSIGLSVLIVGIISSDGETNWLEGVQLLAVYFVIGIAFLLFK